MLHLLNRIFVALLSVPLTRFILTKTICSTSKFMTKFRTKVFGHPVVVRRRINKWTKPKYEATKCFHKFENGYDVFYYVANTTAPNRWHKYNKVKMEMNGQKWVRSSQTTINRMYGQIV